MKINYVETSLVPEDEILDASEALSAYVDSLYETVSEMDLDAPEASLCLHEDDKMRKRVHEVWNAKSSPELRHVFVIGIGGSMLGFKAFYDAKYSLSDEHGGRRRFHFLDTVGPRVLDYIHRQVGALKSPKEALFIAISKSGSTTETAFNLEAAYSELRARFGDAADERFVFVTDEGSFMWEVADFKGIERIPMPKAVGGRFSVFSAAGMLPLLAAGFNIDRLSDIAASARNLCLGEDEDENPAIASAAILKSHLDEGRSINNLFVFGPELESLGKWYRQLVGESLGKLEDLDGDVVRAGMTPIVSVGSLDLHSVGQLYFEGPDDKFTTFLSMDGPDTRDIPEDQAFELVPDLGGRTGGELIASIQGGVEAAYEDAGLPFMSVRLEGVEDIAAFMQWKMVETMYLAKLMNVNAFDQPGVEAYKRNVRDMLGER